jgi:hypothetical protein
MSNKNEYEPEIVVAMNTAFKRGLAVGFVLLSLVLFIGGIGAYDHVRKVEPAVCQMRTLESPMGNDMLASYRYSELTFINGRPVDRSNVYACKTLGGERPTIIWDDNP